MGINSQTPQTLGGSEREVITPNSEELVIYIDENEGEGCQPMRENIKNPGVVGERKEVPPTKDRDGHDLGASCSNQSNNNSTSQPKKGVKYKNDDTQRTTPSPPREWKKGANTRVHQKPRN